MKKAVIGFAVLVAAVTTGAAFAATVTVTPTDTSWGPSDTRPGGAVSFSAAYGAPAGLGTSALRLTTTNDNAAKADYWTASVNGTPLSQVNALAYWTYQAAASFAGGDASLQLAIDVNGADPGGFTTLVYEPYWNGAVTNGAWQHWDATGGQWWSTKTVGTLVAGGGGPPLYTIAQVAAGNPNAVVLAIGVNVGSYNPGYDVATDGVQFNDTTWNFELPPPMPTTKDQCKDGGWQSYGVFKNQGDCVSWVQTGGANAPG